MKVCGIYKIVHVPTGRCYVGQSIGIEGRLKGHRKMLKAGKHHSPHLQRSWDKYGGQEFAFELLQTCSRDSLDETEQHWIDSSNSVFNVCRIAHSTKGTVRSELTRQRNRAATLSASPETRRKMSEAASKRTLGMAQRLKIGAANKGKKRGPDTKLKQSIAALGNEKWVGRKHSAETKALMSVSNKAAWERRKVVGAGN